MMTALALVMVMMLVFMLVMTALALVMVVMLVLMLVTAAFFVVMMSLLFKSFNLRLKCIRSLDSVKKLCACQLIPVGRNDNGVGIVLLYKRNALIDLFLAKELCMAEDDASRILYLIVKELAKILHVHLALFGVNHGGKSAKDSALCIRALDRLNNVRKLTYARGLDKNSVGGKLAYNLGESLCKVTYK